MKRIYSMLALALSLILASCSSDTLNGSADCGYITLKVSAVGTTNNVTSRAVPVGYDAKRIYVEIINAAGEKVMSTDDAEEWNGRALQLAPGKYTVNAHSANWNGADSGRDIPYYAASTEVTVVAKEKSEAKLICTLANVKVSVSFDETVKNSFQSAIVEITSAVASAAPQMFDMSKEASLAPAFFPVGKLTATLTIVNNKGEKFTKTDIFDDVKARDHFILRYTTAESGTGSFTISADGDETQYTYTISIPTSASTTLAVNNVNAWAKFAWVEGSIPVSEVTIDKKYVKYKYKAATDTEWMESPATLNGDKYLDTLRNLAPSTAYTVKLVYEDGVNSFSSAERSFTTEEARALPNGKLDDWCTGQYNGKNCTYPTSSSDYNGGRRFWDTSNPGSSLLSRMVTTEEKTDVHTPGGSAARLGSQYIVIKFAAASMYSGEFGALKGTSGATINFGRDWTARPSQLKGWFKYKGGAINNVNGAPQGVTITKGVTPDLWSAYVVLADEGYTFDNTNISGTAWDYLTDPRVVAYGALDDSKCVNTNDWTEFTFDIKYHDLVRKPHTIIIVFSSSKYGDYFTGCDSSVLLLDDLEFVYGEPTKK